MGFIAVKNKKICPFNNDDEKLDILEFFMMNNVVEK